MKHVQLRLLAAFAAAAVLAAAIALPLVAHAQDSAPEAAASSSDAIDEVVVSGEQPGPSLWKVSRGEHVMWVLGTQSPLPKKMTWRSREVEDVIARAKLVLAQEQVNPDIGFFRGIRLLPAALRARKNPDGAELKDVLPPELYARWSALKARYIGKDSGIEHWRPMFAGFQLYSKALEKSGLSRSNVVWPVLRKLAKKHDVRIQEPSVRVKIDDPRGLLRDFTETPREADIACFTATLDRLETDLEPMKQRASAWAVGDIETLQRLRAPAREAACFEAITSVPRLQAEVSRIRAQAIDEWMSLVDTALTRHDVILAVLPMSEILSADGRLSRLEAKGYTVERP